MRWGCGCGSFRAGVRVISGFSTLTSRRCLAAGRRGSTAVIISRPCWYSLGSGATLRSCRRRFRGQPEGCSGFLTDSPWDDEVIIGRLQEYLGTRLEHPEGVWVLDGSDFPKQGRKSVGVARQYCGRLGKVANCQAGMFLAYVSPLGRALVDKGLYLPESWTSDKDRCEAAGVPEDRQGYRSKTELALEMVGRAQERGHLKAGWVAAGRRLRDVAVLPGGPGGPWGCGTCWTFRPALRCGRRSLPGPVRSIRDSGVPANPGCETVSGRTMEQRSDELPEEAWREITVAEGSQGPRSYLFSAQRVRPTSRRKPGEIHWAVYRRNRDGSEPRYYLSNAPEDTPVGDPGIRGRLPLAYRNGV